MFVVIVDKDRDILQLSCIFLATKADDIFFFYDVTWRMGNKYLEMKKDM